MYNRDVNNGSLQDYVAEHGIVNVTVTSPLNDYGEAVQKIWLKDTYDMNPEEGGDTVGMVLETGRGEYQEDVVYMTTVDKRRLFKIYSTFECDIELSIKDGVTVCKVIADRDIVGNV